MCPKREFRTSKITLMSGVKDVVFYLIHPGKRLVIDFEAVLHVVPSGLELPVFIRIGAQTE